MDDPGVPIYTFGHTEPTGYIDGVHRGTPREVHTRLALEQRAKINTFLASRESARNVVHQPTRSALNVTLTLLLAAIVVVFFLGSVGLLVAAWFR